MSDEIPGEESTLGERLKFAIHKERHRGINAVENALMLKYPERWRSRGFMSRWTNRPGATVDPVAMKLVAEYLHVAFEWLMLGSGPMRRGGRGDTPAEEAMFFARDMGVRSDAFDIAWQRNKDRAETLTVIEWFDEIRGEAERLERAGVPRPEAVTATTDKKASIRRTATKVTRARAAKKTAVPASEVPDSPRVASK